MEDDINSAPLNPYESIPVVPPQIKSPIPKKIIIIVVGVLLLFLISALAFFLLPKIIQQNTSIIVSPTPLPGNEIPTNTQQDFLLELDLPIGKEVIIPKTTVSLILEKSSAPNPKCNDCVTSTVLQAKQEGNTKALSFVCGGFTGECINKLDAYGYMIELISSNTSLAKVKITR